MLIFYIFGILKYLIFYLKSVRNFTQSVQLTADISAENTQIKNLVDYTK